MYFVVVDAAGAVVGAAAGAAVAAAAGGLVAVGAAAGAVVAVGAAGGLVAVGCGVAVGVAPQAASRTLANVPAESMKNSRRGILTTGGLLFLIGSRSPFSSPQGRLFRRG